MKRVPSSRKTKKVYFLVFLKEGTIFQLGDQNSATLDVEFEKRAYKIQQLRLKSYF